MTKIILCEGSTDAVLIGYYLINVNNWTARDNSKNKFKKPFEVPFDSSSQMPYWYNRGDDFLVIWAVGGVDRIGPALEEILKINASLAKNWIDKIVVISDRDHEKSESDLLRELTSVFTRNDVVVSLENNTWDHTQQLSEFEDELNIDVACIILPFDQTGAIETFMLKILSEQPDEEHLINHAKQAVKDFVSGKYLLKPRERIKAELGTSLALMYPEKVFTKIDDLIKSIRWEEYKGIRDEFSLLNAL